MVLVRIDGAQAGAPVVEVDGALGLVELLLVHRSVLAAIGAPVEGPLHEGGCLVHHLHLPGDADAERLRNIQTVGIMSDGFTTLSTFLLVGMLPS